MKNFNIPTDDEMRPEYDFSKGVRGKHYKALREGYSVTIHQEDGATVIQQFKLEENAVVLEPDVYEYFPDSESVNNALRLLISLAPKKRKPVVKTRKSKPREDPSSANQTPTVNSGS